MLEMFSWTLHDYRMSSGVRGMLVRPDDSFFNNNEEVEEVQPDQNTVLTEQVIIQIFGLVVNFNDFRFRTQLPTWFYAY